MSNYQTSMNYFLSTYARSAALMTSDNVSPRAAAFASASSHSSSSTRMLRSLVPYGMSAGPAGAEAFAHAENGVEVQCADGLAVGHVFQAFHDFGDVVVGRVGDDAVLADEVLDHLRCVHVPTVTLSVGTGQEVVA